MRNLRYFVLSLSLTICVGLSLGFAPSKFLQETIVFEGAQLSLIENVRLSTRDPGIVETVDVSEGQTIAFGDVVATLDQEMFAAEYNAAESELAIARQETKNDVDLRYAVVSAEMNEKVLDRSRNAAQQFKKSVSQTELERLDLELQRSNFARQQAERTLEVNRLAEQFKTEQLEIADIRLRNRSLKSPIDGTIVELYRQPGEWVNTGDPIARIVNLKRLRVKCLCDASTVSHAQLSTNATFVTTVNGVTISLPARIVFLSPEIDPVEQDFAVWAEIENDGRLHPGVVGQLKIQLQ